MKLSFGLASQKLCFFKSQKILEKKTKNASDEYFLIFPQYFLPFQNRISIPKSRSFNQKCYIQHQFYI